MSHKLKQWQLRRQLTPPVDRQRRWDRAYQNLLLWSQTTATNTPVTPNCTKTYQQQQSEGCTASYGRDVYLGAVTASHTIRED